MAFALFLLVAASLTPTAAVADANLSAVLDAVALDISSRYNCSVAMSFISAEQMVLGAAGFTDAGLNLGHRTRRARPDDVYVWGSTTKMFTGAAVLRLLDAGKLRLTDPIPMHIDPFLLHANGTKLEDHFGPAIKEVTVGMLLHMTSSITDYDYPPYTVAQFADRGHDFAPIEILSRFVPALNTSGPAPGTQQDYCSTNYILLGLLLTSHSKPAAGGAWTWQSYSQRDVVPPTLRPGFGRSTFVDAGRCSAFTPVHGFLQHYDGMDLPAQDVWNVSCTGGRTAGNYVGPVEDVARFTWELYRPGGTVVSAAAQRHLTNFTPPSPSPFSWYGMGTFDLGWSIGGNLSAWGHVGDTYGYQSQTTYFPARPGVEGFALAVATNVETTNQAQPADATCHAYHALVAAMSGTPPPRCHFTVPHHFIGRCTCVP